jgi:hypothetical protein
MKRIPPQQQISPKGQTKMVMALGLLMLLVLPTTARVCLDFGFNWPCPMRTLFEIPCLTCGGTRALAALTQLDLPEAIRFNPLVAGLALGGPFIAPLNRWFVGDVRRIGAFILILAFLNWIYLILYLPI